MQAPMVQPLDSDILGNEDATNVEVLMAKEMASLSTTDRERIYHDIHGISDEVLESRDFVRKSLQKMEEELASSPLDKRGYKLAMKQNPMYVQSNQLRLRFLRADRFDPKGAAKRFILHFNIKQEMFGDKLLTKDITQDDLEPDDLDVLYNCVSYRMAVQDPAGRFVLIYKSQSANVNMRAYARRLFYAAMVCGEDEVTQRKGCVIVSYLVGQKSTFEEIGKRRELNFWNATVFCAVPLRVEAVHLCIDSYFWRPFLAIFKLTSSMFTRLRCREHFGDHQSVLFSLQTHGLTLDYEETVMTSTESNAMFWKKRQMLERKFSSDDNVVTAVVPIPSRFDVLLGRGKTTYSHIGNTRLRNLVERYAKEYEDAPFSEKTVIADVIILQIKEDSGRFLRDDGFGWIQVDDETARKKVAHAFRTLRGQKADKVSTTEAKADKKRGRDR